MPIIFATLFYISYLLENWQYYTRQEDLITVSIPSTVTWIERMKHALPMVWWKASCVSTECIYSIKKTYPIS